MTRTVLCLVALSSLPLVAGCGEEDPVVFADILFQTRCQRQSGCTDYDTHDVNNLDGEEGFDIVCNSEPQTNGNRLVGFSAHSPDGWSVELRNLVLPPQDETMISQIGMGLVQIQEDDFTYEGSITANPPTATAPCRAFDLIVKQTSDGASLEGKFVCFDISARQDQTQKRDVTSQQASIMTNPPECSPSMPPCTITTEPARFRIVNCVGL